MSNARAFPRTSGGVDNRRTTADAGPEVSKFRGKPGRCMLECDT